MKKGKKHRETMRLQIFATPDERAALLKAARQKGMLLTAFCKDVLLKNFNPENTLNVSEAGAPK